MTEQDAQPTTQAADEAADDIQVTPEDTPTTPDEEKQDTFDRAYVEKLRQEAAQTRRKLRALEKAEEDRKNASLSETERLKAEKQQAETTAQEATTKANRRIINAEARLQSLEVGVRPDHAGALVGLADLSDIEVNDDGEPDAKAIKRALKAKLEEYPALKAGKGVLKDGFNPGGSEPAEKDLSDQIKEAEKAGNWPLAVALKGQLTASQKT